MEASTDRTDAAFTSLPTRDSPSTPPSHLPPSPMARKQPEQVIFPRKHQFCFKPRGGKIPRAQPIVSSLQLNPPAEPPQPGSKPRRTLLACAQHGRRGYGWFGSPRLGRAPVPPTAQSTTSSISQFPPPPRVRAWFHPRTHVCANTGRDLGSSERG